jgi:hypothetical protein
VSTRLCTRSEGGTTAYTEAATSRSVANNATPAQPACLRTRRRGLKHNITPGPAREDRKRQNRNILGEREPEQTPTDCSRQAHKVAGGLYHLQPRGINVLRYPSDQNIFAAWGPEGTAQ